MMKNRLKVYRDNINMFPVYICIGDRKVMEKVVSMVFDGLKLEFDTPGRCHSIQNVKDCKPPIIFVYTDQINLPLAAHEVLHAIGMVYDHIGQDMNTEEITCYIMQDLMGSYEWLSQEENGSWLTAAKIAKWMKGQVGNE